MITGRLADRVLAPLARFPQAAWSDARALAMTPAPLNQ